MTKSYRNITTAKSPNTPSRISIIIPAAGLGTRLKSYGPISSLLINQKPLIEHQLQCIYKHFKTTNIEYEIILVAGYKANLIFNNTPNNIIKIENENYEDTNVARSIGLGLRACTSQKVLIIYGDLAFNIQSLNIPLTQQSALIVDKSNTMKDNEIGCTITNDLIKHLSYDITPKWGQIAYFTGHELHLLRQICWTPNSQCSYGFEVLNKIIERKGVLHAVSPDSAKMVDIDVSKDVITAQKILN